MEDLLSKLKQKKWDEDFFLSQRPEVLAMWKTGKDVDLDDAVAYHRSMPPMKNTGRLLAKAKELSCGGDTMSFILKDQQGWYILKKMGYPVDSIDIERVTFEMEDLSKDVKDYISTVSDMNILEDTDG